MREQFEKGLSRRNRGGSLAVAAAQITHLIRFCYQRRVDPSDLTDNQFREFMAYLMAEMSRSRPGQKRRNANSNIAIGRKCLEFLGSVGRHSGIPDLVSEQGQIRAIRRTHRVKLSGRDSGLRAIEYWDHAALPNADPHRRRMPIALGKIEEMRAAVSKLSKTSHQRQRRHTMLRLLEVTGARRGEIAEITVDDIRKASEMELPMLRLPTLKKRGGRAPYRWVPISRHDVTFIRQYADVHRRSILRRRRPGRPDHGLLLISEIDGEPLRPNSITQEVRHLRIAAGIMEKACAQMFRHRFITKLFVALLEQHNIENQDEFRRLLIDGEQLKQKVAEWTGHSRLESLDTYIHLAFDEVCNFKRAYDMTSVSRAIDSFGGTIAAELDAVHAGDQPLLILKRLEVQLENLKADLERAKAVAPEVHFGGDRQAQLGNQAQH
jgi:integrase